MTYDFEVSDQIPAPPRGDLRRVALERGAYRDDRAAEPTSMPDEGGDFDAWDGYIHGMTLAPGPYAESSSRGARRTSPMSTATHRSKSSSRATTRAPSLRVRHSNVPDDQRGYEEGGWQKSYFDPMKAYFEA